MTFEQIQPADFPRVKKLYIEAFTASENENEGRVVGELAASLLASVQADDLHAFMAKAEGQVVGAIIFSRLTFDRPLNAFILSPVAVHPDNQGQGMGQALITHGLAQLKAAGVELVMTYGDPKYYGQVGFKPVSIDTIPAPFALSQPIGWIGQSLRGEPLEPIPGKSTCVQPLARPELW